MHPHDTTPDGVPLKRCKKCKEEKPATTEHFARSSSRKDGWQHWCKACQARQHQLTIEASRARDKRHYLANKEKIIEYQRAYRAANKAKIAERYRRYYERNRNRLIAASGRYAIQNREIANKWARQWRINNKEKIKATASRRRAAKIGSGGGHTPHDVRRQLKSQKGKCYYCGAKVGKTYHVDHVVPLTRGGSDGPENIVIACPHCNQSKSNKLPHEWPQGGRLL